jgi:hypothetical protein
LAMAACPKLRGPAQKRFIKRPDRGHTDLMQTPGMILKMIPFTKIGRNSASG